MDKTLTMEFSFNGDNKAITLFKEILFNMVMNNITISIDKEWCHVTSETIAIKFAGNKEKIRKILTQGWFPDLENNEEWEEALRRI